MSKYYNIKGLKIRVSDHEPNFSMDRFRGQNNIELYVRSIENKLLSVESQIEDICEKNNYDINDFAQVIEEWKDGSYGIDVFVTKDLEEVSEISKEQADRYHQNRSNSNNEKSQILKNYSLSRFARHEEIKKLSEETGISQSYIKKHFGI